MFLRFVITEIDSDSKQPQGLFVAAYTLLESGELSPDEYEQLHEILTWFSKNLRAPDVKSAKAIFWFKPDANDCVNKMWDLVQLLRFHGYLVEMQKYRMLRKIIYEDSLQVAAVPSRLDVK